MKALMKSVAVLSAFMLLMHSVVPHVHHRHLSAADIEISEVADADLVTILSEAFHSNHAPKDLEELTASSTETPAIPAMALAILADWATALNIPDYELPAMPIYTPKAGLPAKDHFTGNLIISRPPPVC
jgi:hypothetical protein